jgi:hypothetical protein
MLIQHPSDISIGATKDLVYDVLAVISTHLCAERMPIYTGSSGEGIRLVRTFHLKHHRSLRPLQHHNLARPLPRLTLPLLRTIPHLLNNILHLLTRVTPQARCLQARIRAPAFNRAFRSSTWTLPQGRHISSLGKTSRKQKRESGKRSEKNWGWRQDLETMRNLGSSSPTAHQSVPEDRLMRPLPLFLPIQVSLWSIEKRGEI